MRGVTFLASVGVAAALPQWTSWADSSYSHAVYVMSNNVTGNSVIAMSVGSDGSLAGGSAYSTGRNGGNYINSKSGKAEFPLALSSQDSLIQVGGVSLRADVLALS